MSAPLQNRTAGGNSTPPSQSVPDPEVAQFLEVWKQPSIPVVYKRRPGEKLVVKLPYRRDNHFWLRGFGRTRPEWNPITHTWNVPTSWFEPIVKQALNRYGKVYVIQGHNKKETCAPACWNARGIDCQCSCIGTHHGAGHPGGRWYELSETFAVRHWGRELSCRLFTTAAAAATAVVKCGIS